MPSDKPTLTTPLLSFDFRATLAGKANELAKSAPATEPPPTPQPPSGPRRRMATKKASAAPKIAPSVPAPTAERPLWHRVVRNWKTQDEQLDYELRFDAEGDPQVTVLDANSIEGETEPVTLSVSLETLDEAIGILQSIRVNAARIMKGELTAEDTIEEEGAARRRVDEPEEEDE